MVDDAEFIKRRHLSRGRPRKYEPGPGGSSGNQGRQGGACQDDHHEALENNHDGVKPE